MGKRLLIVAGVGILAALCFVVGLLTGSGTKPPSVATGAVIVQTAAPQATYTALPTYTAQPAATGQASLATVIVTVFVTVEHKFYYPVTVTPPAATDTPDVTDTAVPTANSKTATAAALGPLIASHDDGNFLVNTDIAPGHWRNDGSATTDNDCYWERLNANGGIIDNYIGAGKGAMFVAATDYQVHSNNCGTWTYLGP